MKTTRRAKRGARELFRACLVDGLLDAPRTRRVAGELAGSKRRGSLALLSAFQRLVRLEHERRTAIVESAAPLADGMRADIVARLHRMYGPSLDTTFGENPALIGGVRIKVGSDVYDGSVRARLAALEASL
jgi:F-type H+-transporting ATPase subunit delta